VPTCFAARDLLAPPTERAAFSDRQAYVCAELCKLASFRFEGGHALEQALEIARVVFRGDARLKAFEAQLRVILAATAGTEPDGISLLRQFLATGGFELVDVFNVTGTLGFLCLRRLTLASGTVKTMAFLVFRGTEPTAFQELRTDLRAGLRARTQGQETFELHDGFLTAFERVEVQIVALLGATPHDQLFLTGHSVGGALAMIATRLLAPDGSGACYTFGAPPIGAIELQDTLKTPIYEIVNELDIVPRLPNPWLAAAFVYGLRALRLLAKSVTVLNTLLADGKWDRKLQVYVDAMTRCRHPGYMSYLTGSGQQARLRYNVDDFDRLGWWTRMMLKRTLRGFGQLVEDHAIDAYLAKLVVNARARRDP
jgi:pimeloyl-ACP methyl ester carboxylesterase